MPREKNARIARNRGFVRFIHTVHRREIAALYVFSYRGWSRTVGKNVLRGAAPKDWISNRTQPHRIVHGIRKTALNLTVGFLISEAVP